MSALSVNPPFPIFTNTDGQPLENGYIWIGTVNLDPQGNPITVYWDAALTQVAGQPIRTSGGYPVRNGSPARIYTGSEYSIRVQNKNGSTVYSAPAATEFISSTNVSFQPAGANATYRTVQSKLRDTVSVKDFGAVGNGIADDTDAIQAALNSGATKVYVPAGTYRVGIVYVNSNQEFFGDGAASVLQALDATTNSQYIVATYAYSGGTSNPADNKRNIYIHDLKLDGRRRDLGGQQFVHAMTINATSDMVVERVVFYDFRGDGCYVGSGTTSGIERHNLNVTFRDCMFDGVGKYSRNGLSVIDCDGIVVDACTFQNIGNPTLSQSVGGIDFEPNNTFNIYRHAKITNCVFKDIDTTNTAGVTFFNSQQVGDNIYDWLVDGCSFINCYWGIATSSKNKTPSSDPDSLAITNCTFRNSKLEDIRVDGLKDVVIANNSFSLYPKNSSSYRGAIKVGAPASGLPEPGIDVKIVNNSFSGLRPQFGAVQVWSVRGLRVDNNSFEDIQGACIQLLTNVTTGFRYLEDIVITNNKANTSSTGISPNTTGLVLANSGIGNEFVNSTCILANNVVMNAIQLNRATALAVFREQPLSAAPTTGSWEAGNKIQLTAPSAGSLYQVCSVSGTFGTLTGVTADATNGSNAITNVAGTDFALLREGQYITVSGDATVRRIILIDGTTMYLSGNYGGATGTGLALAWSAPTFVVA